MTMFTQSRIKLQQMLSLTLFCGVLGMSVFAQTDAVDIPPPSSEPPDRIRIPISTAQEKIANHDVGNASEEDIAAFAIAAQAGGWIPENSSGWIKNGMMIRITVMVQGKIEHITEAQRINYSGKIGLPLLQNVKVGEMDLESVEQNLTEAYSRYYKEPLVNVEFVGDTEDPSLCPWGYVTLMGNVQNAGPLSMPATQLLTISGAVKRAGGLAASAKKGSIKIFRPHPEEQTVEVIRVNLDELTKQGNQAEDAKLRAGDVVYIPERIF
ncbi:polysaccharide biosynthesis/export family protein [Kiritimatiellota bacterium B12222]|nr:polysaccharide biosynthesis/export family protein [Kiritimatiellota bacterium B12222]